MASSIGLETRGWVDHSWGGVVKLASLQGLVCFGPDQGQKATFVHRDRWLHGLLGSATGDGDAKGSDAAPAEDAGAFLMRRYLRSYGPATWRDFASWTGMKVSDTACIGGRLAGDLAEVSVEGQPAWVLRENLEAIRQTAALSAPGALTPGPSVRLLPSFDPFLLGHADKSRFVDDDYYKRVFRKAGWLSPVLPVNGRIAGVWALKRKGRKLVITVELFGVLSSDERDLVAAEADNLGRFLGMPTQLRIVWATAMLGRRTQRRGLQCESHRVEMVPPRVNENAAPYLQTHSWQQSSGYRALATECCTTLYGLP